MVHDLFIACEEFLNDTAALKNALTHTKLHALMSRPQQVGVKHSQAMNSETSSTVGPDLKLEADQENGQRQNRQRGPSKQQFRWLSAL